mgnify:CR=1 FL=1
MTGRTDVPPRIDEPAAREQVVEACRRMHQQGLIAGGEGNVSVRLSATRLLVTPSGVNKGFLEPSDLVVIDREGRPEVAGARVSTEVKVHLAAYRARPDIGAVVHAHPPTAIAFTLAGLSLDQRLVPESVVALGEIPTAAYATPSTADVALGIERLLRDHDVVMMERHGSVCVGANVLAACDRLESLEHTARISFLARSLGSPVPLPADEVARLHRLAEVQGGARRPHPAPATARPAVPPDPAAVDAAVQQVLSRVLDALQRGR